MLPLTKRDRKMPKTFRKFATKRRFASKSSAYKPYSHNKPVYFLKSSDRAAKAVNQPNRAYTQMFRPSPFTDVYRTSHTYVSNYIIFANAVAGLVGTEHTFSLNSVFDPDVTIAGHQPYGRDQCAAIWGRYKVYAVKWEIQCVANQTGLAWIAQVDSSVGALGLSGAGIEAAMERYNVNYRIINTGGNAAMQWTKFMRIADIEGCTDAMFNANIAQYAAGAGGPPTNQPLLRTACANIVGGITGELDVTIKLTYYTEWSVRQTQAQS